MKTFKKSLILCVAICAFCTNWTALALDKGFVYMQQYNIEGKPNGFELLEEERWVNIPGYEGRYQASTWGRIKALEKTKGARVYPEKIMSARINKRNGYYRIGLRMNKKPQKHFSVHRLIAMCFHLNIENKPCINHKDGIKTNNWPSNIEWSTVAENTQHAYDNNLIKLNFGADNYISIKVINVKTKATYACIKEAALKNNIDYLHLWYMLTKAPINKTDFKIQE